MRTTLPFLVAAAFMFASCGSRWSDADQQSYTASCLEGEKARGTSDLTARAYCECALDKASKRYATLTEAAAADSTDMAQDLEICRRSTR